MAEPAAKKSKEDAGEPLSKKGEREQQQQKSYQWFFSLSFSLFLSLSHLRPSLSLGFSLSLSLTLSPSPSLSTHSSPAGMEGAGKLWGGRFTGATDPLMEAFNESLSFDKRMFLVSGVLQGEREGDGEGRKGKRDR